MRSGMWLVFAVVSACGGAAGGGISTGEVAPTRQSDVLSRQEIEGAQGLTSAMDAIQRLRPRFFRNSGPRSLRATESGPSVRIDNEMVGGVEALRSIAISEIQEVRFYSAVDATARFGGINGRPVIHIVRRGASAR